MRWYLTLVMCCVALPAVAQIYKWVDEKGVTHYGEKAPEGAKAKEMAVSSGGASQSQAPKSYTGELQEKDNDFKRRQVSRAEAEAQASKQKAALEHNCLEARDSLARMRVTGCLYELNNKGERICQSDAVRAAAVTKLENDIRQYCK